MNLSAVKGRLISFSLFLLEENAIMPITHTAGCGHIWKCCQYLGHIPGSVFILEVTIGSVVSIEATSGSVVSIEATSGRVLHTEATSV